MDKSEKVNFRKQLVKHIKGGEAFSTIDELLGIMPFEQLGVVPDGLPYSFYQLFYHIRIAQKDILDYCLDENYSAPDWPDDYWPDKKAPEDSESWNRFTDSFFKEREQFCDLLLNPENNLTEPFEENQNHNLLRQAELIIEHTAYHTGQLYVIYRLLTSANK